MEVWSLKHLNSWKRFPLGFSGCVFTTIRERHGDKSSNRTAHQSRSSSLRSPLGTSRVRKQEPRELDRSTLVGSRLFGFHSCQAPCFVLQLLYTNISQGHTSTCPPFAYIFPSLLEHQTCLLYILQHSLNQSLSQLQLKDQLTLPLPLPNPPHHRPQQ